MNKEEGGSTESQSHGKINCPFEESATTTSSEGEAEGRGGQKKTRWRASSVQKQMLENIYGAYISRGPLMKKEAEEFIMELNKQGPPLNLKNFRKWLQNRKYKEQKQQQQGGATPSTRSSKATAGGSTAKGEASAAPNSSEGNKPMMTIGLDDQGFICIGSPRSER